MTQIFQTFSMENASAHSELDLLLTEQTYIKEGGSFESYQFKRTCVIDSLLAAFHTTCLKYPNVKAFLDSDELFGKLMALLHDKKYPEARNLCVKKLPHVKPNDRTKELDFYGTVYEHCWMSTLLDTLVCETNINPLCKEKFRFLKALGDPAEPTLILGQCLSPQQLMNIEDEKKRIFALQFLLLGKGKHMTMCFQLKKAIGKNNWRLYDNAANKPSFQPFDLESLKDYEITLAGYVNITLEQEYKCGIPETGGIAEVKPSDSGASSSTSLPPWLVEDKEMEDLSSYPLSIPETGGIAAVKPSDSGASSSTSLPPWLVEDKEMEDLSSYPLSIPETGLGLGTIPF